MARARGRIPRPWLRKGTGSWYVTLDGEQVPLGKSKRDAHAEFARIMANRGRAVSYSKLSVRQLGELWLADRKRAVKPITYRTYAPKIESWIGFAGDLLASDLKLYHVEQWISRLEGVRSPSSRSLWLTVVKMTTRWAAIQGYLDKDPLRGLKVPSMGRRSPTNKAMLEAVAKASSPELREILTVFVLTGMRAGELSSMTIEGTDLDRGVARVVGKSGERDVWLSSAAVEVLRRLIGIRTSGPVWPGLTGNKIQGRIRRARDKAGVTGFSAHRLRGLFTTEAIRSGVDSLLVSTLLGHRDPTIVQRHYAAPDDEMLHGAAEKVAGIAGEVKRDRKRG